MYACLARMLQGSFGAISRTPCLHGQPDVAFKATTDVLPQQTNNLLHTKPTNTAHQGNTTHVILPSMLPVAERGLHLSRTACWLSILPLCGCARVCSSYYLTVPLAIISLCRMQGACDQCFNEHAILPHVHADPCSADERWSGTTGPCS